MANKITVVHVSHEITGKIGGIGAVFQGLFTCNPYLEAVDRSILVGPLFTTEGPASARLGEHGEVLYSSVDGLVNTGYHDAFKKIENYYKTGIVYGRRTFTDSHTGIKSSPEVLLIDVRHMDRWPINEFKKQLFVTFDIHSDLYENLWEFEQYVRLAPAAIAALKAIGAAGESTIIVSHEFMGMPTVLAAILDTSCEFKTIFYAHEVATMRRIVEKCPGHDTMFYNVIRQACNNRLYVNDLFGDQNSFFKHPLVEAAKHCDSICAVGNYVAKELSFLSPEFDKKDDIDIVYNGIPAYQITVSDKLKSKEKLRAYCENLLNYRPDFVFTHVTRLVQSKGLWRDLRVLEHLEKEFRTQGKTAVLFLLATEVHQRRPGDIYEMESSYNWPVAHREEMPDLSGGEAAFYTGVQEFNAKSKNIKVVFINQFGFEPKYCGSRMPQNMEFMDLRKGSDVEFGLSIYEPFGIAPLETLTFGGICVISSVSGCAGFLQEVTGGDGTKSVIIADYTDLGNNYYPDVGSLLHIDRPVRERIERNVSERVAMQICSRLPKDETEIENMIQTGYRIAQNMSWDAVVKNHLLRSLKKALNKGSTETVFSKT
jgi:hypothetical protein